MLTVQETAARINVSTDVVYDWVTWCRLPFIRVGKEGKRGTIRIDETDLEVFLQSLKHEKGPSLPAPKPVKKKKRSTFRHLNIR